MPYSERMPGAYSSLSFVRYFSCYTLLQRLGEQLRGGIEVKDRTFHLRVSVNIVLQ